MDFKELWDKAGTPDMPSPDRAELAAMLGKESRGLLAKLKGLLRAKLLWGVGISLLMSICLPLAWGNLPVMLILGCMTLMGAILMGVIYRHYRRLPDHLDMSQAMLPLMRDYDRIVRQALRFEERVGAVYILPSPAMGALLGILVTGQRSIGEILSDPKMLLLLGGLTLVVSPFTIWLSKRMNRYAFGQYLDQLRKNIAALEAA